MVLVEEEIPLIRRGISKGSPGSPGTPGALG